MPVQPCPPSPAPTVRGIVAFNAAEFKAMFPSFATVADGLLQADFDIATIFLNNSCCSIVRDGNTRLKLLYLVTAHIAALIQGENGKPPSGIVGRVDSATEGSVSVSAEYAKDMSMSEAYFSQTQYGAMFWQGTATFRSMHYIPPPASACVGGIPGYNWPGFNPGGNRC